MSQKQDELKIAAAESAVALLTDGMVVGLGSGSTAAFAVSAIGRRVNRGLRIRGVPTSERTGEQARELGIPITSLAEEPEIDITIDGADQVEKSTLNLIKGHGGALLREKIVASSSKRLVIVVDDSKLVDRLALNDPVPVEVVPFGWEATARRLSKLGARSSLRRDSNGEPFRSDGGNYILNCTFEAGGSPAELADGLDHVVGLVEHGLFIGLTSAVHAAGPDGVRVLK